VIFRDILLAKAGENNTWGPVFQLEALTTNLTFDVIGRATLGIRLNKQTRAAPSLLRRALLDQLTHYLFDYNILTLAKILSPIRQWKMARNTRIMRQFLRPHIISSKLQGGGSDSAHTAGRDSPLEESDTVVDFAVKEWNKEAALLQHEGGPYPKRLDADEFIDTVIAQLKLFLFTGHDTTATSIYWVLHCLAKHPGAAASVCAEHDVVLGEAGTNETIQRLRASPRVLHQLPYTLACVKGALRL